MHWSCRRCTSTQNTWQQTKHFNQNFDRNGLFLFFKFQRSTFNLEIDSPRTSNRIYLQRNSFSNHISQGNVHNLKRN